MREWPLSSGKGIYSFLIFLTLFSSACVPKTESAKDALRIQLSEEPASLDWHKATDIPSQTVLLSLMATLTDYKFKDAEPILVPGLADSWSSAKNHTRWTFTLKKSVLWSDGLPFDSAQVVLSFQRLLEPDTAAFNAYYFYSIEGAEEFNKGDLKDFEKVGIKAIDSHTVVFNLKHPQVYFPKLLALFNTAPWRPDLRQSSGVLVWDKNTPTLGPYKFKSYQRGERLLLSRNDKYFGKRPGLRNIEFRILREAATALNLFKLNRLDILTQLPESEKIALKKDPQYREIEELSIEYIGFNTRVSPFTEKKVRKSFRDAVKPDEIVRLLGGGETPNPAFIPIGVIPADWISERKAGQEVSVTDAVKEAPLTLTFPSEPKQKRIAEQLQAQWKERLGVEVELQGQDWKVFLGRVNSHPPMLYRLGWMAIYPDPSLFLGIWTSDSHYNTSGWSSGKYDQLVKSMEAEADPKERESLITQALAILQEEAVVIPLFRGARQEMVREEVKGYNPNSLNRPQLHLVSKQGAESQTH